jgi:hypothetical protein
MAPAIGFFLPVDPTLPGSILFEWEHSSLQLAPRHTTDSVALLGSHDVDDLDIGIQHALPG